MTALTIIGLGLNSEEDISLRGLEAARQAEEIYLEDYTSLLADLSMSRLEELVKKPVRLLTRDSLEHPGLTGFLQDITSKNVALLVPGDPLTATTHQAVRQQAIRQGFQVNIIHGASIFTAAPGLAGLFIYKFGPSSTITFPDNPSTAPYETIRENRSRGLHTLLFLDIRKGESRYMSIQEALKILNDAESRERGGIIISESLFVGIARAGSERPFVRAGPFTELSSLDFGAPPHVLIAPGRLHFMEEESLNLLKTRP